jgi:hypothetical protein
VPSLDLNHLILPDIEHGLNMLWLELKFLFEMNRGKSVLSFQLFCRETYLECWIRLRWRLAHDLAGSDETSETFLMGKRIT